MPRYKFQCSSCQHEVIVFLQIGEVLLNCDVCESKNTMVKQYNQFFSKTMSSSEQQKVGNITNEYIEKNKEILEQQKKEARSAEYEPS